MPFPNIVIASARSLYCLATREMAAVLFSA
nr:MAG TPA: hypothetical protein [Caudoviricetes sp.]